MTNDELKRAAQRLLAAGFTPEDIRRARQRVKPSRPKRVHGDWSLKSEKPGPCRTLSVSEMLAEGYKVDES